MDEHYAKELRWAACMNQQPPAARFWRLTYRVREENRDRRTDHEVR